MRLIAEITMPNRGSWNGGWSGEKDKNTLSFNAGVKKAEELIGKYRYSFGDGWVAGIEIREPQPRERATGKFCGYDWMLTSIRMHGDIVYPSDRVKENKNARN